MLSGDMVQILLHCLDPHTFVAFSAVFTEYNWQWYVTAHQHQLVDLIEYCASEQQYAPLQFIKSVCQNDLLCCILSLNKHCCRHIFALANRAMDDVDTVWRWLGMWGNAEICQLGMELLNSTANSFRICIESASKRGNFEVVQYMLQYNVWCFQAVENCIYHSTALSDKIFTVLTGHAACSKVDLKRAVTLLHQQAMMMSPYDDRYYVLYDMLDQHNVT